MINLLCIVLIGYTEEPWRWTHFGDFRVVNSISVGPRYIYVGGKGGIMRFDKLKGGWLVPVTHKAFPQDVRLVVEDIAHNEVWFTTSTALGRYNPVFEDYKLFDFSGYSNPCSLGLAEDYVYLWNSHKCMRFDKLSSEWKKLDSLPSEADWFPKASPSQYPWLAPYYVMDKYLNRYEMTCAVRDGEWVWVGTCGQGIYKYNAMSYIPEQYILGFSGRGALAMMRDENYIWVATPIELVRWDLNKGASSFYLLVSEHSLLESELPELLPSEAVSIVSDEERIWLGSPYGLFKFDKSIGKYEIVSSDRVTALALEGNKLWIGTRDGLFNLEGGAKQEVFKNLWVNDIKIKDKRRETKAEEIWVATSRGVIRRVGEKQLLSAEGWEKFDDPDKILPHGVYRILFDEEKIYFGSTRQGLLVYRNGEWERFTYPVYLPGERILSISADSIRVYIGTDRGVSIWDKERNFWKQYTETNSPITGGVYSIFLDKQNAYFGTENGLVKLLLEE